MEFRPACRADEYDGVAHQVLPEMLDADMPARLPHGEITRPDVDSPPHMAPGSEPTR